MQNSANSLQNKDSRASRCPSPGGVFPPVIRLSGHSLSLAADIAALEECLALERSSASFASGSASEGIHSPPAVPYCEFLMLRDPAGRLQAVARLMRLDRDNPIGNPLASGGFRLSPLLTALRYSREGILEMGAPVFAHGCDAAKSARLLWSGLIRFVERNGLGFVIGRERVNVGAEALTAVPRLMEAHGVHPDLETDLPQRFQALGSAPAPVGRGNAPEWPAGLRQALLSGCRLACEPAFHPATGSLDFVWVASRDMLETDADWRGGRRP